MPQIINRSLGKRVESLGLCQQPAGINVISQEYIGTLSPQKYQTNYTTLRFKIDKASIRE